MNTDNILNESDVDQFLRNIGLKVGKDVVSTVLESLTGKSSTSIYELYSSKPRRDGTTRIATCGKGTADKIKRLFNNGELQPYIQYLDEVSRRSEEYKPQLDEEDRLTEKGSRKQVDTIYESHAKLSIKPPITDPHNRLDLVLHKHNEAACIMSIESGSILIESLQTRSSDVEVAYQVMLFESDPHRMLGGVRQEDMIQMERVTKRIHTFPIGNAIPYTNRDGEKNLYAAISVYSRNIPIDFLSGELNDKRREYLEHAVDFTLALRYRVR